MTNSSCFFFNKQRCVILLQTEVCYSFTNHSKQLLMRFLLEEVVGGKELENCFEYSVHFLRSFSSDTYQEGSSEWRAQKRPSIYRRSRAVIGR